MMRLRPYVPFVVGAALTGLATFPLPLAAQFVDPPPPAAYALQGVTVVNADGGRLAGVNIVIRDGLIEAMGPNVELPADAEVLEGDSLMVFPGFIDAQGTAEYEFPEPEVERSQIKPWAPPRTAQSFVPHRKVVDYLTATGEDLTDQRKKGVVAAAVLADGRLMPGRGTVLLYRKDAGTPQELVMIPEMGPVLSFRGAPGVYPSQVFTVMAFIRQSFEDAQRDGLILQAYAENPVGVPTPSWDPDYAVLREVLDGQTVYFMADQAEDIRNALTLQDEYGLRPVIVGGGEAWKAADRLRQNNVPVFVSLDFPSPDRWEPEQPDSGEEATAEQELDAAAQQEKERIEGYYANAARLAESGVTFALTSGGGDADIREGVRKAIEYGLSEADALQAVTATPATLLGIPYLVNIDQGMAATFIVTDGELFAEETHIAYTFVAGAMEKGQLGGGGGGEAPAVDMTGTWEIVIDGDMMATMTLTQQEGAVSGTFSLGDMGSGDVSGTVSGNSISFTIDVTAGGQAMEVGIEGTVSGDSASGDGTSPMGDFSWTAEKKGGPGEEARR
jgi:imidazolonepropionase-like amidohydrolase